MRWVMSPSLSPVAELRAGRREDRSTLTLALSLSTLERLLVVRTSTVDRVEVLVLYRLSPHSAAITMASSEAELTKKVAGMVVATGSAGEGGETAAAVLAGTTKPKKKSSGGGKQQQQPKVPPREWTTEMQCDYERILTVGEECISAEELKGLITAKGRGSDYQGFNLYDGFEPSGRMHIAQGVFKVCLQTTSSEHGRTTLLVLVDSNPPTYLSFEMPHMIRLLYPSRLIHIVPLEYNHILQQISRRP